MPFHGKPPTNFESVPIERGWITALGQLSHTITYPNLISFWGTETQESSTYGIYMDSNQEVDKPHF